MTPNAIFSIVNVVALAAWLLLAVFARRPRIVQVAVGVAVPALLATLYVAIVVANWAGSEGGFSSLADVALLFSNPWLLLAGWTHYLAFDLLVGCWEARDALARAVPFWLLLPCLGLTFMFGPAGWLLYLVASRALVSAPLARPAR